MPDCEIAYGTVRYSLPSAWLFRYLVFEEYSDPEDILDLLWGRFRSAPNSATDAAIEDRLHCWVVPSQPDPSINWSAFFEDGGPIHLYRTMVQLVATYSSWIADSGYSRTDYCARGRFGDEPLTFGLFVNSLCHGVSTYLSQTQTECDLRVFVIAVDDRNSDQASSCVTEQQGGNPFACGEGRTSSDGSKNCGDTADAWAPGSLVTAKYADGNSYTSWRTSDHSDAATIPNGCADGLRANGGNFALRMHSTEFGFKGFILDWLLFWARAAVDYASTGPDPGTWLDLLLKARTMATFALSLPAEMGRVLIHEIGHTYLGGGHCDPWRCCFDMSARAWLCRTQAELGLQNDIVHMSDLGKEPLPFGSAYASACTAGSTDDGISQYYFTWCDLVEPGLGGMGEEAYFTAYDPECEVKGSSTCS